MIDLGGHLIHSNVQVSISLTGNAESYSTTITGGELVDEVVDISGSMYHSNISIAISETGSVRGGNLVIVGGELVRTANAHTTHTHPTLRLILPIHRRTPHPLVRWTSCWIWPATPRTQGSASMLTVLLASFWTATSTSASAS